MSPNIFVINWRYVKYNSSKAIMGEVIIGNWQISSVTPSNAGSVRSWMFSLIPSNDSATEEKLEAGNNTTIITITHIKSCKQRRFFFKKNTFTCRVFSDELEERQHSQAAHPLGAEERGGGWMVGIGVFE